MNRREFKATIIAEIRNNGLPKEAQVLRGEDYVIYLNTLRDLDGVITSLREEFELYANIEIVETWVALIPKTVETPWGEQTYDKLDPQDKRPVYADPYTHVFAVHSPDKNLLEYVQWKVSKHLKDYNRAKRIFGLSPKIHPRDPKAAEQFIEDFFSKHG